MLYPFKPHSVVFFEVYWDIYEVPSSLLILSQAYRCWKEAVSEGGVAGRVKVRFNKLGCNQKRNHFDTNLIGIKKPL